MIRVFLLYVDLEVAARLKKNRLIQILKFIENLAEMIKNIMVLINKFCEMIKFFLLVCERRRNTSNINFSAVGLLRENISQMLRIDRY